MYARQPRALPLLYVFVDQILSRLVIVGVRLRELFLLALDTVDVIAALFFLPDSREFRFGAFDPRLEIIGGLIVEGVGSLTGAFKRLPPCEFGLRSLPTPSRAGGATSTPHRRA